MDIMCDEAKRLKTLKERGLNSLDAPLVFAKTHFDIIDDRFDYGEVRFTTFGELHDRPVAIVWTGRDGMRRIISMRHTHAEEFERRKTALD